MNLSKLYSVIESILNPQQNDNQYLDGYNNGVILNVKDVIRSGWSFTIDGARNPSDTYDYFKLQFNTTNGYVQVNDYESADILEGIRSSTGYQNKVLWLTKNDTTDYSDYWVYVYTSEATAFNLAADSHNVNRWQKLDGFVAEFLYRPSNPGINKDDMQQTLYVYIIHNEAGIPSYSPNPSLNGSVNVPNGVVNVNYDTEAMFYSGGFDVEDHVDFVLTSSDTGGGTYAKFEMTKTQLKFSGPSDDNITITPSGVGTNSSTSKVVTWQTNSALDNVWVYAKRKSGNGVLDNSSAINQWVSLNSSSWKAFKIAINESATTEEINLEIFVSSDRTNFTPGTFSAPNQSEKYSKIADVKLVAESDVVSLVPWDQALYVSNGTTKAAFTANWSTEYMFSGISPGGEDELCTTSLLMPASSDPKVNGSYWEASCGVNDQNYVGFTYARTRIHSRDGRVKVRHVWDRPVVFGNESSAQNAFKGNIWKKEFASTLLKTGTFSTPRNREYMCQMYDHEGGNELMSIKMHLIDEAIANTNNVSKIMVSTDNSFVEYYPGSNTSRSYELGHDNVRESTIYALYSRPTEVQSTLTSDNWGWYNDSANISIVRNSTSNGKEGYYYYPYEFGYEYLIFLRLDSSTELVQAHIILPETATSSAYYQWRASASRTKNLYGAETAGNIVASTNAPYTASRAAVGFQYNATPSQRKLYVNGRNTGNSALHLASQDYCIYKRPIPFKA